jgi:hypothetical protein
VQHPDGKHAGYLRAVRWYDHRRDDDHRRHHDHRYHHHRRDRDDHDRHDRWWNERWRNDHRWLHYGLELGREQRRADVFPLRPDLLGELALLPADPLHERPLRLPSAVTRAGEG